MKPNMSFFTCVRRPFRVSLC